MNLNGSLGLSSFACMGSKQQQNPTAQRQGSGANERGQMQRGESASWAEALAHMDSQQFSC